MNRVSARWREFGILLDISMNQLDAWEEQHRGIASSCWSRVVEHWLNGGGTHSYPDSWDGLYSLLEDVGYLDIAETMKEAVTLAAYSRTVY